MGGDDLYTVLNELISLFGHLSVILDQKKDKKICPQRWPNDLIPNIYKREHIIAKPAVGEVTLMLHLASRNTSVF